jgi:hypothetical protein
MASILEASTLAVSSTLLFSPSSSRTYIIFFCFVSLEFDKTSAIILSIAIPLDLGLLVPNRAPDHCKEAGSPQTSMAVLPPLRLGQTCMQFAKFGFSCSNASRIFLVLILASLHSPTKQPNKPQYMTMWCTNLQVLAGWRRNAKYNTKSPCVRILLRTPLQDHFVVSAQIPLFWGCSGGNSGMLENVVMWLT